MRSVDPAQLEELARKLDGENGVAGAMNEAFERARNLDASGMLAGLRPLRTWVDETGPELRSRAAHARLEDGDPAAGLLLAGFTTAELGDHDGVFSPDDLLLANTAAANDALPPREDGEGIDDYLNRLAAHLIAHAPGLEPHEATIDELLKLGRDALSFTAAAAVVAAQGGALLRLRHGGKLVAPGSGITSFIVNRGVVPGLRAVTGRTAVTIGALLTSFGKNRVRRDDLIGAGLKAARKSALFQANVGGLSLARFSSALLGSEAAALNLGARSAGQANLVKMFSKSYRAARTASNSTRVASALGTGLKDVGRVSGYLRGAGVVGGVLSTGYSVANVLSQDPGKAWKEDKVGYMADWAEVGFNASLTAAMVAPNPATIGAAVVTGAVYGGLKAWEHKDTIKEYGGKVVKEASKLADAALDTAGRAVDGLKSGLGKLNPWG